MISTGLDPGDLAKCMLQPLRTAAAPVRFSAAHMPRACARVGVRLGSACSG